MLPMTKRAETHWANLMKISIECRAQRVDVTRSAVKILAATAICLSPSLLTCLSSALALSKQTKEWNEFHWRKKNRMTRTWKTMMGKKSRARRWSFSRKAFYAFLYYYLIQSSGSSADRPSHILSTRRFSILLLLSFLFHSLLVCWRAGVLVLFSLFHWPLYDYVEYADLLFSVSRCRDTFTQSIYATRIYVRAKMCKQTNCKTNKKYRTNANKTKMSSTK